MKKNKKDLLLFYIILLIFLLYLGGIYITATLKTTDKDTLLSNIQEHTMAEQDKTEGDTNKKNIIDNNIVKSTEEITTKDDATYYLHEYQEKYEQIPKDDMKEWYIQYKQLTEQYSNYIEKRITIYDIFTQEELNLLFAIVEAEVRGDTYFEEKTHVASVILNRLKSSDFPNDLYEVLTAPQQFASYTSGIYAQIPIYETTILACEYAFECGDNTYGALYFDSRGEDSWNIGINEYIFSDGVGHSFYK